jgi:Uma2 family endonuclease
MRNTSGQPSRQLTVAQYLELEELSTVKHELVGGELYAMTGTTIRHNRIAGNVFARLKAAERRGPCRVFIADIKVRAGEDVVYYPDLVVMCGTSEPSDVVASSPCAIVEVTSRGTARIDRGEKLAAYRNLASLQIYLIVDQYRRRVTCHRRDDAGQWRTIDVEQAGTIDIPCPRSQLTLDEIYEDVELPPLGVAEPEPDGEESEYAPERG